MGIYDKTCPQCMASSTAATVRCTCGYLFDSSASDERSLTLERVAREEKLFEEYLEARLAQAQEAAIVATHAADLDPENQRKAIEALRAKQAAEKAAAGLATQRIKAAQAAHAAGVSFAMRSSLTPNPSSIAPPDIVTRATVPVNGTTVRPYVTPRPKEQWPPKHDSNRTMPPLRTNNAAPHTQTVTSKFATAAGRTLSLPPPKSLRAGAHRADDEGKPPIPVLTMAVPRQALTPAPIRNNGIKVFESKMVFDGSPWRDAAKKMATKAARRVAGAAAHGAKKAAKGIGRAAASGAKRAGRAAARGASKAAKHMAKAAAHTAKQAAHAMQQRRDAMKVRAARTSPALGLPPTATTPPRALTNAVVKPAVTAGERRGVTTTMRAKAAIPKRAPTTAPPSTVTKRSPSPTRVPSPPVKPVTASARSVEAKQRPQPSEDFRAMQAAKIEKAISAARRLERKLPASEIECALCSASLPANADGCLCGWRVPNHEREIPALEPANSGARNGNELTVVFRSIECPLCAATIAANATRCQCGWHVPEGVNELPPVALSNEEISALSKGALLDELGKPR